MASRQLSPIGGEMTSEEKEEREIEFFLEAFRSYIEQTVDHKDLLFYTYFTVEQRKAFRNKAVHKSNAEVTGEMLDTILQMKDKPDRFAALVTLFQDEFENQKVLQILKGEKMPSNINKQKENISKCMKIICENLNVTHIIPSLLKHKLIVSREADELRKLDKNSSTFDAALKLVLNILPNRSENWYAQFVICLIDSHHEELAKKLDENLCNAYMIHKQQKEEENSSWSIRDTIGFCELYGQSSLMPGPKGSSFKDTLRSSDETYCKEIYKEELTLDENTQLKTVVETEDTAVKQPYLNGAQFDTMEAPVLAEKYEPSLDCNNLSPNKAEDDSLASVKSVESVKRSLDDSLTDMSLSFSSLLNNTDNITVKSETGMFLSSLTSLPGERSYDSEGSGNGTLDSQQSFDSLLQNMEQSVARVSNSREILTSNTFSGNTNEEKKRSFGEFQKLTKSKSYPSDDVKGAACNAVEIYDRKVSSNFNDSLKYMRNNSQSPSFKELKDKDIYMNEQEKYNITETDTTGLEDDQDNREEVEDKDISLRNYQQELAEPAIQGKNVIIVAPTGSGKTRVAMKIIQEHFRQQKGRGIAKVVFLVNQVALANQQGEACKELLKKYTSKVITGESQRKSECLKDFIDKRDILIVTAQVLFDALIRKEISSINCFSLIIFDECHHTHANHTFNQIMGRYMDLKFDKTDSVLPQIVGLTASVGVGKAKNEEKAVEHIKHLMANLDAQVISTVKNNVSELRQHVSLPEEETFTVPKRQNDVFQGNVVKLMNTIEKMMSQSSLVKEIPEATKFESALKAPAQKGTPQYTQWVSKLWKETAKLKNSDARRFLNPCRAHLEHYNKALIIYNDARMQDALNYLDTEMNKWKENANMDRNESQLYGAFKKLRGAKFTDCPNPKLLKLGEMIKKAYKDNFENSRGIVFVKTRDLCKAILSWMQETPGLRELNPVPFVGTNMAADKGGMTKAEQVDALQYFRDGKHKLIIATSVAEEGLDISKCNLVIRYDHVTNEIAMVQSRGRGRAADSKYFVIAEDTTGMAEKEELNMIREVMMRKAIIQLQRYIANDPERFRQEIHKFQDEANLDRELKSLGSRRKIIRTGQFELRCIKCDHFICWSDDVKKIEGSHHVVVDDHLENRVSFARSGSSRYQDETIQFVGKLICKECGGNLGVICIHRTVEFPVLKIENFLIVDTNGRQDTCKKWKSVPFHVAPLTSDDWKTIIKARKERVHFE